VATSTDDEDARLHRAQAWVLLVGTILVAGAAQGLYAAAGIPPSGRYELLVRVGLLVLLWNWYVAQCRPHRRALVPDLGLFLGILWPVLLPGALWAKQRWRGVAKVAAIGAAHVLGYVLTLVIYFLARGSE
jgi:hypothetical protein